MEREPEEEQPLTPERHEDLRINSIIIPADDEQLLQQGDLPVEGLVERQQLVGGLIQGIDLREPQARLYCNEEGKVMELPPNKRATLLLWTHNPAFRYQDFIVGDALLVGPVTKRYTDSNVPGEYVRTLFESTRFRVEVKPQGEDKWQEHPERFDDWVSAYEHAVGWGAGLVPHSLEVRVVPEA